jgi:hypothetical protein
MNIVLIPHNWTRHVVIAFTTGAAALVVWWVLLNWLILLGPFLFEAGLLWAPQAEGTILFSLAAMVIAATHISAEGGLRRRALVWKVGLPFIAGLLAALFTGLFVFGIEFLTPILVKPLYPATGIVLESPHTATLRYRLAEWLVAGSIVGLSTLIVRVTWSYMTFLGQFIPENVKPFLEVPKDPERVGIWSGINHLLAGPGSALLGAAIWQLFSHVLIKDMFVATALGLGTWGFVFGLTCWGVPSDLYAGWIRVLSSHRFGHRIPIDTPDGGVVERVAGHYPRGLDVWLPAEYGVAELHASFVKASDGAYTVRGLSQQPLALKRSLETIDLTYDKNSPVPLETDLRMEDTVVMGPKGQQTVVEFILLPKEER